MKENSNSSVIRSNNFNILRFLAALMVMAGHMGYILGTSVPQLWGEQIQVLGVRIFFLIGGFLITKSWFSDPHFLRYCVKRVSRIWSALIAYVLFVTFIAGPLVTSLPVREYFTNSGVTRYLKNIIFYIEYSLPGVFYTNPYPYAVNGSLWTLPVEMIMYFAVPFIILLSRLKNGSKSSYCILSGVVLFICILQILHLHFFPQWRYVIYGTDIAQALNLIPYYLIGMFYSLPFVKKYLNLQVAAAIFMLYSCFSPGYMINEILMFVVLPYFVFSFALADNACFTKCFVKTEISYGLYLYGFFIQQLVVWLLLKNNITCIPAVLVFIISVVLTIVCAVLSYRLVEEPAAKLSKKILQKIK